MMAASRRKTGLPHRIVIDEAHYFLHERNIGELLDLNLGAYTLVTYRLADLDPGLRNAIECIILKRTTESFEHRALDGILQARDCRPAVLIDLAALRMDEAVLLPGVQEAGRRCLKFTLSPRLTSHVRHKAKYLDMQLVTEQGFWFCGEKAIAGPARTLKEFVNLLGQVAPEVVAGHAHRGDFSRWVGEVFHDHVLASEIRKIEQRFRLGHIHNLTEAISKLIEERYEFSPWQVDEMQTREQQPTDPAQMNVNAPNLAADRSSS